MGIKVICRVFNLELNNDATSLIHALQPSVNLLFLLHILQTFWQSHDPPTGNRQGNDIGSQYRSVIYTSTEEQLSAALASRDVYQNDLGASRPITTEIRMLTQFYYAEPYHQQYLHRNPAGYCGLQGTGVRCSLGEIS